MKLFFPILTLFLFVSSCKKNVDDINNNSNNNCSNCYYLRLIDTLKASPLSDSALVSSQLKGNWGLKAVTIGTKYSDNGSLEYKDSIPFNIHLQISDSTYAFFKTDSLVISCSYYISKEGMMNGDGCSFYYGNLFNSKVCYHNSYLGISSVFPGAALCFSVFEKIK